VKIFASTNLDTHHVFNILLTECIWHAENNLCSFLFHLSKYRIFCMQFFFSFITVRSYPMMDPHCEHNDGARLPLYENG